MKGGIVLKDNLTDKFLIYEVDNSVKVEDILEKENFWLRQEQISKLYNKAKSTINEHIKHIFEEKEIDKRS